MQMTKELTVFKSKDIDNIDVHAKGCVNNAPHSKVATRSGLPDLKGAVNNILLSKIATRSGLPDTKGTFSKHTLADTAWTR